MDKSNNQKLISELSNMLPFAEEFLRSELQKNEKKINEMKQSFMIKNKIQIETFQELIEWFDTLINRAKKSREIMEIELTMADFRYSFGLHKILIQNLDAEGNQLGLYYKSHVLEKLHLFCDSISQNTNINFSLADPLSYESRTYKNITDKLKDILIQLECDPNSIEIIISMDIEMDRFIAEQIQKDFNEELNNDELINQILMNNLFNDNTHHNNNNYASKKKRRRHRR